jgi:hypothetical protein
MVVPKPIETDEEVSKDEKDRDDREDKGDKGDIGDKGDKGDIGDIGDKGDIGDIEASKTSTPKAQDEPTSAKFVDAIEDDTVKSQALSPDAPKTSSPKRDDDDSSPTKVRRYSTTRQSMEAPLPEVPPKEDTRAKLEKSAREMERENAIRAQLMETARRMDEENAKLTQQNDKSATAADKTYEGQSDEKRKGPVEVLRQTPPNEAIKSPVSQPDRWSPAWPLEMVDQPTKEPESTIVPPTESTKSHDLPSEVVESQRSHDSPIEIIEPQKSPNSPKVTSPAHHESPADIKRRMDADLIMAKKAASEMEKDSKLEEKSHDEPSEMQEISNPDRKPPRRSVRWQESEAFPIGTPVRQSPHSSLSSVSPPVLPERDFSGVGQVDIEAQHPIEERKIKSERMSMGWAIFYWIVIIVIAVLLIVAFLAYFS